MVEIFHVSSSSSIRQFQLDVFHSTDFMGDMAFVTPIGSLKVQMLIRLDLGLVVVSSL